MRQFDGSIDHAALTALSAIGVAWFGMTTLVVNFGLWQQGIRFYDLWAVIQDPGGRLSGINNSHALATFGFGLVCAAAVAAPAVAVFYRRKDAWLTYLFPFILMTVTCVVLYVKSSTSYFPADPASHSVSALFARIAQGVATRAGETVASHISIGAGAYVAMLSSCLLALRGLGRLRATGTRADARDVEKLAPPRQCDTGARQIEP